MKKKLVVEEKSVLTKKNVKELEKELKVLIHFKRKEVIEELKQATNQGDLSENAEYDAGKQKQVEIEERIQKINLLLKNSEIVKKQKEKIVSIGKKVKLLDLKSGEEMSFQIGTIFEINSEKNIISNRSPLVKSILGSKVGEQVLIKCGSDRPSYWVKILSIDWLIN